MPLPLPTSRFPLLGKAAAIGLVLLALTLALEAVSGIVHEREGRLREAEASVAASLAGSQTVLGPLLQRDCSETWEAVQGEGKDRKVVTERRTWKLAAAPADLDVSAQVALEPRYRGIFKVNGYVMKATLAATWPDGGALVPRAEHAGSRVRCDAPQVLLALGDTRGVRSASVQVDGGDAAVLPGTGHRVASARLPCRRRRRLGRRGEAARGADGDRARRHRRPGARAGRRIDRVALALGLAASVVRGRFLPLERTVDDTGFRAVWKLNALATTAPQEAAAGAPACASAAPPPMRRRGASAAPASRPSASPSSIR
jgi:inner membrane protein